MLLIDRKEMRLVFKHRSAADCDAERVRGVIYVLIDETHPEGFRCLTTLEMKILYRNLGAVSGTSISDATAVRLAIIKLLKHRLDNYPTNKDEIPLFTSSTSNEIVRPHKTESPVDDGQQAPKGSTSTLIWDVADEFWINAGKPTDVKIILSLRRTIMANLEHDHSVKKNTASNELGRWQKARI